MTPEITNQLASNIIPETPELLRNHEAFLSAFIARVVVGSETYKDQFVHNGVVPEHRKPKITVLEIGASVNRITTFAQLSEHIVSDAIAEDVRNGLGRRVYHAVSSLGCSPVTISPQVMHKCDRWMERTFGEDRVRRYKLEVDRQKAAEV